MTFESQPLQEGKSEKQLLEDEKASVLKQLADLDAIDIDFLEREDVRLESEILFVKEKLAEFFSDDAVKEEYDPTEFSIEERLVIEKLFTEKESLINERKKIRSFLKRDKDEMQSELLDTLADLQSKLRNL